MELLSGVGGIALLVGLFLLVVLGILLPVSAYSAQKYAYKAFRELEKLNAKVAKLGER